MYPIPHTETLVETKTCRHCSALFPITDKDLEFYEKVSPVFPLNRHSELVSESSAFPNNKEDPGSSPGWRNIKIEGDKVRYLIPTPTLCPDCRQQRRLSFRNERKLYKRNCDATGKSIISIYSPDKPFKVYHQDFWWSDKWDPMEYGRDFDFERWFFEQFGELLGEMPLPALRVLWTVDSPYLNACGYSAHCYMCFNTDYSEDCMYCNNTFKGMNCMDISNSSHCEYCFDSINIHSCTKLFLSKDCKNSHNCFWCSLLDGCNHCIDCTNLRNQEYHYKNKPIGKTEFDQLWTQKMSWLQNMYILSQQESRAFQFLHPVPCLTNISCENVIWDYIENCKDCFNCFECTDDQNCKHCSVICDSNDMYDNDIWWYSSSLCYEIASSWNTNHKCAFNHSSSTNMLESYYCESCTNCQNIFWCIWLSDKSYCILNKQYTREEYETLVPRIIEHMMKSPLTPLTKGGSDEGEEGMEWGEFFPSSLSPFGYNETVAMEYYPLNPPSPTLPPEGEGSKMFSFSPWGKDAWKADRGTFNWSFYEAPFPKVEKIISADKLPDDISKIPDDILNWAIECEVTKKPFRIIRQELEFYRKHHLPIPRRHPDVRHADRMALRNPRKLFERKCDKCGVEMVTTYAPERKEVVYCEGCYEKEVIW